MTPAKTASKAARAGATAMAPIGAGADWQQLGAGSDCGTGQDLPQQEGLPDQAPAREAAIPRARIAAAKPLIAIV